MDPLSVAGSIAGLISLGDTIFRKLYHYTKSVQNAGKEIKDLKNEIAALNGVLHNLHLVAQDLESDSTVNYSIRTDHVIACQATLHKVHEQLKQIHLADGGKAAHKLQRLVWPFKAVKVKEIIEELQQHHNNLSLALAADSLTALIRCLSKHDEVLKQLEEIDTKLRNREDVETRIALDEERERVLDYFLFVDPTKAFRTSLSLRYRTTGSWLAESDIFTAWLRATGTHLWLSGIPGAGKTVLSSLIVQECMARATEHRAVAFFYCDYKSSDSLNIVYLLGAVASQLARQNESSFLVLKKYYAKLRPQHHLKSEPELEELVDVIKDMSSTFEDVRVIIDGIDECGKDAIEACRVLRSIASDNASLSFSLLSRDELDIREQIGPPFSHHIEIAAQTKDVENYVRAEIEYRMRKNVLRLKSLNLKEDIVSQLVSRADGMFRWVSCQLDHLCELPTDALRRRALKKLPKTLYETYDRILMRISESAVPLVRRALQWIAYATTPLNPEALIEIVSLGPDDKALNPEAYPDVEEILRSCGSLVRRAQGSLELAHFTVLEFLEAIEPSHKLLRKFRLKQDDKVVLAKTCVQYLCLPSFNRPPHMQSVNEDSNFPFHSHASIYLVDYCEGLEWDEDLFEGLQELFNRRKSYNLTHFALKITHEKTISVSENLANSVCSDKFGAIHIAAMLGLSRICQWLLDEGCDVAQESLLGTPLECAILGPENSVDNQTRLLRSEVSETIRLLLEAGAMQNQGTRFKNHDCSLSSVVSLGPLDSEGPFVKMLEHGMPFESDAIKLNGVYENIEAEYAEALVVAIQQVANAKISPDVRIQLREFEKSYKIKRITRVPSAKPWKDETFFITVNYSIMYNDIDALENRLMHDPRFSLDMTPMQRTGSLLHLAIDHNSIEVAKVLLTIGFDPTKVDDEGRTALHTAVAYGIEDEELLRRLAQSSAPEIIDKQGNSVWHEAARYGRHRIVQLLCEEKGQTSQTIRLQSENGCTPLLEAIIGGHSACALSLLNALATDVTAFSSLDTLRYTVFKGLHDVLEVLLNLGVHINNLERQQNALYFLSATTTQETVDLLLQHACDPDQRDTSGRTPFTAIFVGDVFPRMYVTSSNRLAQDWLIQESILETLATPESISSVDKNGKGAWHYFCTKMIPIGLGLRGKSHMDRLIKILMVLIHRGALKAHEDIQGRSGIALLVESCLDAPILSKDHDTNLSSRKSGEMAATTLLLSALSTNVHMRTFIRHQQVIRLLVWAVVNRKRDLVVKLLDLGVDPRIASGYYAGFTAIDKCITSDVDSKFLRLLLNRAGPLKFVARDSDGSLVYFRLCGNSNEVLSESDHVASLEAVLQAGIDPDNRSAFGQKTMAHVASESGRLEILKLLVQYKANLRLRDAVGWTSIQLAAMRGHVHVLAYLRDQIQDNDLWLATCSAVGVPTSPLGKILYPGCSLLHFAAWLGSAETLHFLDDTGLFSDLDLETQNGVTPLHLAVCAANSSATEWLISKGADINKPLAARRRTPLHLAMRADSISNILVLIEAGAKLHPDSKGVTPAMEANPIIRNELIQALAHAAFEVPPAMMDDLKDSFRIQTPGCLFEAIINGDLESCRYILQSGQSIAEALNCGSCTPLIVALAEEKMEVVDFLLQEGASTTGSPCEKYRQKNGVFTSALHIAISKPIFNDKLKTLLSLSLRQDGHWMNPSSTQRPLHIAAVYNSAAIELLITYVKRHMDLLGDDLQGAKPTVKSRGVLNEFIDSQWIPSPKAVQPWGVKGGTALHLAAMNKNPSAVEILLSFGASTDSRAFNSQTPLHCAASAGCLESAKKLLQAGAMPQCVDNWLQTPFMAACAKGADEIVSLLLTYEVDKRYTNIRGNTALYLAVDASHLKIFSRLLEAGWDPSQSGFRSTSPAHLALDTNNFATYMHAKGFDMSAMAQNVEDQYPIEGSYWFLRCLSKADRKEYLNRSNRFGLTPLVLAAIDGDVKKLREFVAAGAELDMCCQEHCTALVAACRAGQIESIKYLVRQGAELRCPSTHVVMGAIEAAMLYPSILKWFLVERYTEQYKITNAAFNTENTGTIRPYSGIRNVQIPLQGSWERPYNVSLFEHAKSLHGVAKNDWRIMVPLGWKPTKHFTPLMDEKENQ